MAPKRSKAKVIQDAAQTWTGQCEARKAALKKPMVKAPEAHIESLAELLGGVGLGETAASVVEGAVNDSQEWKPEYDKDETL